LEDFDPAVFPVFVVVGVEVNVGSEVVGVAVGIEVVGVAVGIEVVGP
jgi:hypothetical protein